MVNVSPLQIMKIQRGCGCKGPRTQSHGTRKGRVVSFMLDRLYPRGKPEVLILRTKLLWVTQRILLYQLFFFFSYSSGWTNTHVRDVKWVVSTMMLLWQPLRHTDVWCRSSDLFCPWQAYLHIIWTCFSETFILVPVEHVHPQLWKVLWNWSSWK